LPDPATDPGYVGWATVGNGTFGASELDPVVVTTKNGFINAISGSKQKLVIVKGTINLGTGYFDLGSNKTIRGWHDPANPADNGVLCQGTIKISGQSNVILQNLTICDARDPNPVWDPEDGSGAWNTNYDCIAISGSTRVWVDHCEIYNTPISEAEYIGIYGSNTHYEPYYCYDGLLDITNGSNYVTVSYCNVYNNSKTCLLGSSDSSTVDSGKLKVTWHHNYFHDAGSRGPRVRFGKVHIYNNYYLDFSSAIGRGDYAEIYSEGNYFHRLNAASMRPFLVYDDTGNRGYAYDTGSMTLDCNLVTEPSNTALRPLLATAPTWTPSAYYTYTPDTFTDAGQAATWATALISQAGPREYIHVP